MFWADLKVSVQFFLFFNPQFCLCTKRGAWIVLRVSASLLGLFFKLEMGAEIELAFFWLIKKKEFNNF